MLQIHFQAFRIVSETLEILPNQKDLVKFDLGRKISGTFLLEIVFYFLIKFILQSVPKHLS